MLTVPKMGSMLFKKGRTPQPFRGRFQGRGPHAGAIYGIWYNERMDKTTLYLTPQLRRALADLAERTKRPQAEIVREALTAYIAASPRLKLRSVGAGYDAEVTGATSEDYLRTKFRRR